ncbi:DUF1205 domain-containing protein, partial [Streptomyces sp. SID11233]|nr:DUF1205 domain-containing protein [Streptomyces sp. SID11233]
EFDVVAELPAFQERSHEMLRRSFDGMVAFARAWRPDLVLHDLTAPEGALAAELLHVPSVYHPPGLFGTAETEPGVDLGDGDPSGSFPRYGLPRWNTGHVRYVVDPSPATIRPPHTDALFMGVRYIPYNGAGGIPEDLSRPSDRPRVCVLWGRSAAFDDTGLPALRSALEAVLDQGAEVLLAT